MFAQDFFMEKKLADGFYGNFDFYKAITLYESLAKRHPDDLTLFEKLATIYDHINDSKNAERCYAVLVNSREVKPEYLLNYAHALARNGNYDDAQLYYSKYFVMRPDDPRGTGFAKAYQNLSAFYRDSASFSIQKAPFSSPADDFSPAYFGKTIVFSSDRTGFSMIRSDYNWTQSPYLDLFQAERESKEVKEFSKELNSIYHEGPVTFNQKQDTIIFTRSNYYHSRLHKSNEGVNKLSLFQANWDDQQKRWVHIHPLILNNDQYSVEHPALSPDGKDLYFASDMPGGFGGMDLYVSHRILDANGNPSWGKPVNLGSGVNTPGYEVFPFMDREGNLWFASDGIPGLGGLDIFFAGKSKDGFAKPVNPGYPMNTRFDDFGYITDSAGENGYFSSNRNNSGKNDDIYSIARPFHRILVEVVDAKFHKVLPAAQVGMKTEGTNSTLVENSDLQPVWLTINPYKSYEFSGKKEKYKTNELALSGQLISEVDTLKIPLVQEGPSIKLIGRIYKAMDQTPVQNASVSMVNQSVPSQSEFKSDGNGLFTGELVSGTTFQIQTSHTSGSICGALPILVSTNGIVRDTTIEVKIPLYCEGDIIRLGDIYYDLNKYNIRPDAAIVLDKLLKLMNDFPKMKIELRSHTDSRASAEYNMKLSDNRAKSAAEYLFSKGIARERIVGKGYGESMLINRCADGVPCSEEEHQLNRRTEFKILSLE